MSSITVESKNVGNVNEGASLISANGEFVTLNNTGTIIDNDALITGVAASTNMGAFSGYNIQNVANGSGLPGNIPSLTGDHDIASPTNAWFSSAGTTIGNIDFNLNGLFNLNGFSLWNYNGGNRFGIKDVNILASTDGINYTPISGAPTQFAIGSLVAPTPVQQYSFDPVLAQYVRFSVLSNYGNTATGLSEVQFDGTPLNKAPTAVNFSNITAALDENSDTIKPIKVADITIADDAMGTNNLSLLGTDAASFEIVGTALYLKAGTVLDYETKTSYSVSVNVDDPTVGTTPDASKTFTLSVNDLVENTTPTDLALSSTTVNENVADNSLVGSFSTTDAEGGNFTYALVFGTGSTDNASFTIDGNQLKINKSPNFETQSSYSIRVKTTDAGGLFFEKALTIGVNDVNEAPIAKDDSGFTAGAGIPKSIDITSLISNDTDPDAGARLSITGISDFTNGTAVISGSNVIFTPTASGTSTFKYTLSDGTLTSTATVTLAVGKTFNGGNGKDFLTGTGGDDILNGFNGEDVLNGGAGDDILNGGNGEDVLNGGAGDDILNGGNGSDVLTGGTGRDTFVLAKNAGNDTMTDFTDGTDLIGLSGGLTFGQLTIGGSGSTTLIRFGSETLATLPGVNPTLITSADFIKV